MGGVAAVFGSLFDGDESADADLAGSEDDGGGLFDGFEDFGGDDFF